MESFDQEVARQATTVPTVHDVLAFGQKYFPHYCELSPSRMHRELCERLGVVLDSPDSERDDLAAPRGHAKTTWILTIFGTYCIVRALKHYVILIGSTADTANDELAKIKHELETNEALARDFPEACGRGPVWRDNRIISNNDIKVDALGHGKRIRGRKHRQYRPDLILVDDFENDENVRNKEQRDKAFSWLTKAVLKAGGVGKKFDVFVAGTILHFDSVLARLQDPRKSPGWRSRKYRAVEHWADRQDLWDEWTRRYTDWTKPDEERFAYAQAFYDAHAAEMLAGTQVLWPEGESYLKLMRTLVDEGRSSFDSEKQNEPIDPSECDFPEEWFQWFEEVREADGTVWLVPDHGQRIALADCDVYGACDPSMGKLDKHRDPSAIGSIAAYPKGARGKYQSYWVLDAQIERRHPHVIQENIIKLHVERHYVRFGIEAIQFQELFAEHVQAALLENPDLDGLEIVQLKPLTDKRLRIQKLGPFIHFGRLKFSRKCVELYNQFRFFPQASHDDGPDMVELALETIGALPGLRVLTDDSAGDDERPKSQTQDQIDSIYNRGAEPTEDTCGNCGFRQEQNGRPWCGARRFEIRLQDAACGRWEPRPKGSG